jgi:hypothetical protein
VNPGGYHKKSSHMRGVVIIIIKNLTEMHKVCR